MHRSQELLVSRSGTIDSLADALVHVCLLLCLLLCVLLCPAVALKAKCRDLVLAWSRPIFADADAELKKKRMREREHRCGLVGEICAHAMHAGMHSRGDVTYSKLHTGHLHVPSHAHGTHPSVHRQWACQLSCCCTIL
jgi:hypothetical protein